MNCFMFNLVVFFVCESQQINNDIVIAIGNHNDKILVKQPILSTLPKAYIL